MNKYTRPLPSNAHGYNLLQLEAITLAIKLARLAQRAMPNVASADNYQRIYRRALARASRRGVRFNGPLG